MRNARPWGATDLLYAGQRLARRCPSVPTEGTILAEYAEGATSIGGCSVDPELSYILREGAFRVGELGLNLVCYSLLGIARRASAPFCLEELTYGRCCHCFADLVLEAVDD